MMPMNAGRVARAALLGVALAILPTLSFAQAQQQSTSVIDDLLTRAQNSINDLQYAQAIAFAKQVIDLGDRAPADKQERAMFIMAAANYPEGEPAAQRRSVALATFKQMVRTKLDLTIPSTLRWAGLDSVLAEAKATTFGMAATPAGAQQESVGPTGHIDFNVRASRPAKFYLTLRGPQTSLQVIDTTGVTQATLPLPTMRNDRPSLTSGEYEIAVTAVDASGDSVTSRFIATVTAPALTFATVPVAIDSARILPERTRKYGWKGIIVGGLVAGSIFSFSNTHADTTLKSTVGADSKGAGIAALAGATIIAASFLDKGRSIPAAIAANQRLRDDLATSIRNAQAENANRIATHKTTFVITGAR